MDLEQRFFELRYEADSNELSGTAITYGDTAELPWGKERFEVGAFGNVSGLDVILNAQHERAVPIARTKGGGLNVLDSRESLQVKAKLDIDDPDAAKTLRKVKNNILRGFSIEFRPIDVKPEMENGAWVDVVRRAELVNISVVDRPAYEQSLIDKRSKDMDEKKIEEIVKRAMEQKAGTVDIKALVEEVKTAMRAEVDDALKQRDDATAKAEADKKTAEDARTQTEAEVEQRADLLVTCRAHNLLPKDFDTKGKSLKDLMVAACGDEVKEAATQTEDYLRAKLEAIVERREQAGTTGTSAPSKGNGTALHRPLRIDQMRTIEKGA